MQKPTDCRGCSLERIGNGFTLPDGYGSYKVGICGESAGENEIIHGSPFYKYAQAGSCLERAFELSGLSRNGFRIYNLCQCRPPKDELVKTAKGVKTSYGEQAINHCTIYRDKGFGDYKNIKVMLCMGNLPLQIYAGVSGDAKRKESISSLRGYALPSTVSPGMVCVGCYHPSYIRRGNSDLFPTLLDDIQKGVDIANGTWNAFKGGSGYKEPNYITSPSLDDARCFFYKCKDSLTRPIGFDIETGSSDLEEDERELGEERVTITSIQFSLLGESIFLPWEGEYIKIAKDILQLSNNKMGFNCWNFDERILGENGAVLSVPRSHDIMWMFKHYQPNLERNLQSVSSYYRFPFPWKHLYGKEQETYGCADVHALQVIWNSLPQDMEKAGVWKGYLEHVYRYRSVLKMASDRGMPVDSDTLNSVKLSFERDRAEVFKSLEQSIPIDTRDLGPRRKDKVTGKVDYGYKKIPECLKGLVGTYRSKKARIESKGGRAVSFREFARRHGFLKRDGKWCKIKDLKVSKEQVVRYINWKRQDLLKEEKNEDDNS